MDGDDHFSGRGGQLFLDESDEGPGQEISRRGLDADLGDDLRGIGLKLCLEMDWRSGGNVQWRRLTLQPRGTSGRYHRPTVSRQYWSVIVSAVHEGP